MKKWLAEDWEFTLTALEGEARHCRLGIEQGDRFVFQYGTPADFCPRAMMEIYTWCEVIRCGGDFTQRGCASKPKWSFGAPAAAFVSACRPSRLTETKTENTENK